MSEIPVRAPAEADTVVEKAMESTSDVKVFRQRRFGFFGSSQFLGFEPQGNAKGVGIIIYPGALVDSTMYAPIAKRMAENGYHAAIATPPLRLALLGDVAGRDYGDRIMSYWKDDVKSWAVSGHSMGGVAACAFAKSYEGSKLKGLVLLASYPEDGNLLNGDLSESDYDVISIYGSLDGIALYENVVVKGAKLLPPKTKFVEIEGGNHSQFSYAEGIQETGGKIDGTPTISLEDQQEIVCTNMLELLSKY
jgi:predicted alpha/beta-hydrolase family hydrolase